VRVLLAALVAGCGDGAPSTEPAAPAVEQPELPVLEEGCASAASDALVEHACFHADYGPFRDVVGNAEPPADVSRAHTLFTVALPEGAERRAVLRYRPRSAGGHALFVSEGVEVAVTDAAGTALVEALAHPSELCAPLPTVHVFAFPQQDLLITLRGASREAALVIEQMDEGEVSDGYKAWCEARDAGSVVDGSPPSDGATPTAAVDGGVAQGRDAAADGCPVDPVSEHACLHGERGPYVALAPRAAAWNVSEAHTAFRLAGDASYALRYIATRAGEHVFYSGAELELTVSRAGEALSQLDDVSIELCGSLPRARVFELEAGSYELSANNEGAAEALLVIEAVEPLAPAGWKERFEPCEP
jgi:hypothetical protein